MNKIPAKGSLLIDCSFLYNGLIIDCPSAWRPHHAQGTISLLNFKLKFYTGSTSAGQSGYCLSHRSLLFEIAFHGDPGQVEEAIHSAYQL